MWCFVFELKCPTKSRLAEFPLRLLDLLGSAAPPSSGLPGILFLFARTFRWILQFETVDVPRRLENWADAPDASCCCADVYRMKTYWCLVGNGWEWGNGLLVMTHDYGSFPHSLLSTSKKRPVISLSVTISSLVTNGPAGVAQVPQRGRFEVPW